jgi:hypothetical protein
VAASLDCCPKCAQEVQEENMNIDPTIGGILLVGIIGLLGFFILILVIAGVGFFLYRKRSKQKQEEDEPSLFGSSAGNHPYIRGGVAADAEGFLDDSASEDLISLDDAIEISLATILSGDLAKATQYLGEELRLEDLNTIWVVTDVIPELLIQENYSAEAAGETVKNFKTYLRRLPKMDKVFNQFPATRKEMIEVTTKIDQLVDQYAPVRDLPAGDYFLEQNPILFSLLADMRITVKALENVLDGKETAHWEIKQILYNLRTTGTSKKYP